jgi:hypothetical protein
LKLKNNEPLISVWKYAGCGTSIKHLSIGILREGKVVCSCHSLKYSQWFKNQRIMKNLKIISLFIIFSIVTFSCKKTEEVVVIPKTKTEILTANVWKSNKAFSITNGVSKLIFERGVTPASDRNDLNKFRLTFLKDGTTTSIDADGVKGKTIWKFANNETQLLIGDIDKQSTWQVSRLEVGYFDFSESSYKIELIPE